MVTLAYDTAVIKVMIYPAFSKQATISVCYNIRL